MDREQLRAQWLAEERIAHIRGWDFSHLNGRWEERGDALPWDYAAEVRRVLRPAHRLLDLDTGGGEFLLSLGHPFDRTSATEAYPPNAALCRETLGAKGVDFHEAAADGPLPFADNMFDLVFDRHGSFDPVELYRVLRPGGLFLTEQVGAENDRAAVELLLPGTALPFPELYADRTAARFAAAGFTILRAEEGSYPIRFFDVGALVWFARIIEWEFSGFSVDKCLPRLYAAQERLERDGCLACDARRFLLLAQK